MKKKLTTEQLLWLYSRGGRNSSDVVWIKRKPFVYFTSYYNHLYTVEVGEFSTVEWMKRYNWLPSELENIL